MIAELSELLCGFLPDWHWEVLIGKTNAGLILLIRGSCPPSIVTRQSFRMVAELNKQDSTVSSLSTPEAYVGMLGTYRLEESDKFEEFMQALGVSPFMLLSDGVGMGKRN